MNIKRLTQTLIRRFQTNNPYEIAQGLGYLILTVPLTGIRGFTQQLKRTYVIYLSEGLSESTRLFVCAHELGHILLHRGWNRIFLDGHTLAVTSRYEKQADQFAAELLCPDSLLQEYRDREYTCAQIAAAVGIREDLIRYRMSTLPPPEA